VNELARCTGVNGQAAVDAGHLSASSSATASAVVGTTSMVFFVFGGTAAAAPLQEIHKRAFELSPRTMTAVPRRLAWLAVLIGTGFWWLTMRILPRYQARGPLPTGRGPLG
jgi:hypothetical protein